VLGRLAAGGMGVVYHAVDTRLNRHVALKFLPGNIANDEAARSAFLGEARAASALDHPNIGTVYGIEETEDEQPFIVMAYYDGCNLAARIAAAPLSIDQIAVTAIQIARGLADAHSHNIVHRDIKPSNILLTASGLIKIVDFGLARLVESSQATQSAGTAGTVAYMSPEQALGKRIDGRSDLWSFGMVLYEMAARKRAFDADTVPATLYAIVHSAPAALPDTVPSLLQQIIFRALAKSPDQRYQSASEMLRDLQLLTESGTAPDDPTLTDRLRESLQYAGSSTIQPRHPVFRRSIFAAAGCGVLLLSAAIIPSVREKAASWILSSDPHVAVLPLTTAGGGVEDAALADGLMDRLTSRLSNLQVDKKSLWVVPAGEVRRLKVTDPGAALKAFGANLVVSGTLQRDGSAIRLIVNLIDTRNLRQIGSGEVEDRTGDFSGVQDSAVAKLANLMHIDVTPEMLKNTDGSVVPAAYQSYLTALGYIQRYDKPGNLDKAVSLLENAIDSDPKFALAYSALGEAYLTRFGVSQDGTWLDKAAANTTRALQLNDALAPVHVIMGRIHNAGGNGSLALQEFQRAQQLEPQNADALLGMAQVAKKQQRFKEAETLFRRAAMLRPDYWGGYSALGNFYNRQKRWDEAEKQFQEVIRLTPDNYVGYVNRGASLLRANRLEEASSMLEKAASVAPSYAIYANLGQIHFRRQRYAEAAKATEQALKLNDKDFRLWANLAGMYRHLKRDADAVSIYAKAVPMVEQAIRANPASGELQGQLAELYAYTGAHAEAAKRVGAALALAPDQPEVLVRCADASDAIGQRDRAVELANKALAKGYPIDDLRSDPEARGILSDSRLRLPTRN
jgi:serine/threonine-protein kinase